MKPRTRVLLLATALALLLPGVCFLTRETPVSPFGWRRLIVVHLLTTLPLSLLLAEWLAERWDVASCRLHGLLWSGLGLAAAWLTLSQGEQVGIWLSQDKAGFTARLLTRTLWCLALQLPWCCACRSLAKYPRPDRAPLSAGYLVLALFAAIALPCAYGTQLAEDETAGMPRLLETNLVEANVSAGRLEDVGSADRIANLTPQILNREISRRIQLYSELVATPLAAEASLAEQIQRARMLSVLGRRSEAIERLSSLADRDPGALLLLAALLRDKGRHEESTWRYQQALRMLAEADGSHPEVMQARVRAYEGLAFNARARKAYSEAEAIYHQGIAQVPEARAYFHFQLGLHHDLGGRPSLALQHLREAARLDPTSHAEPASRLIRKLEQHTPGCFFR